MGDNFTYPDPYNNIKKAEYEKIKSFVHSGGAAYGAGTVGRQAYAWLKGIGLGDAVSCFVVTNVSDAPDALDGKPVLSFVEWRLRFPEERAIVSVRQQFRHEIEQTLEQEHVPYLTLTDSFISRIMMKRPIRRAKFQVHLVEHCNLNCCGCFHCSPLAEKEFLDTEVFRTDLERMAELYHGELDELQLLGGEPLLHPQIEDFFRIARTCFPVGNILLVTNGLKMMSMPESFWNTMRECDITIAATEYPIALDYRAIEQNAKDFGVRYMGFPIIADEHGNKLLEHYHFDPSGKHSARENFFRCYRANNCIFLRKGRLYSCVLGANLCHLQKYFHLDMPLEEDGIDIYEAKNAEELAAHLLQPMSACGFCALRDEREMQPFRQTERKLEEWT